MAASLVPVRHLRPGDRPRDWIANDSPAAAVNARACGEPPNAKTRESAANETRAEDHVPAAGAATSPLLSAPQRYHVQFTASEEYVQLLQQAQDLLGPGSSDRALDSVHLRALRLLVDDLTKRKRGAQQTPPKTKSPRRRAGAVRKPRAKAKMRASAGMRRAVRARTKTIRTGAGRARTKMIRASDASAGRARTKMIRASAGRARTKMIRTGAGRARTKMIRASASPPRVLRRAMPPATSLRVCVRRSGTATPVAAPTSTLAASAAAKPAASSSTMKSPSAAAAHPRQKTSAFAAKPTTHWPPNESSANSIWREHAHRREIPPDDCCATRGTRTRAQPQPMIAAPLRATLSVN